MCSSDLPYDYARAVDVAAYQAPVVADDTAASSGAADLDAVTDAERVFDEALRSFKKGNYAAALAGCDKALRLTPKDSVIHEVRGLALFALGRYPEAAATLNAVLASAPGMDWTTVSGLYNSVDTYSAQLRKLEDYCQGHPEDAAAHFVLAYHYLVGGHTDDAAEALRVVVAKQPDDAVAKQLLAAVAPTPAAAAKPESAAVPETDLVGTWRATAADDTVVLTIGEDSSFTWKASPKGGPPVEISGTIDTTRDTIALVSEKAGTMTGKVVPQGPDAFEFTLAAGPPGAKPLVFHKTK